MYFLYVLGLIQQDVKDRDLIINLLLSLHEHLANVAGEHTVAAHFLTSKHCMDWNRYIYEHIKM